MPESTSTEISARLARLDRMGDPLNRFVRYPAARSLLPLALRTRVTPNQVTYFHMLVGLAAAACVAQGSTAGLLIGVAFSELRLVLDCLDGVLARAKGSSSPWGRTLDELGDAVSYVALCIATTWRAHLDPRTAHLHVSAPTLVLLMMAVGGLMGWSTDFYKRKISSALRSGRDGIYDELLPKARRLEHPGAGFVTRFGFWFDWMQVAVLRRETKDELRAALDAKSESPPPSSLTEIAYIRARAEGREVDMCARAISLMSGDNVIGLMNLGLLTGRFASTELLVIGYGIVTMSIGIALCNRLLRRAHGPMLPLLA